MNEKISGQALAVIRETAPPEEPFRTERPLGRAIKERRPVNRLLVRVRRDGIDPRAARRIAVPMGFDVIHVAKSSRVENFFCLSVNNGRNPLTADLHNPICLLCRLNHRKPVFNRVRHRLFAIDVLAGGACIHKNFAVLMVGDCDDDRVHIFAVENLFVIASCRKTWIFYRLLGCGVAGII